jgi:phosphatidylglycerophosphatase A
MPGTWGSLAALPLWWGLTLLGPWSYGLAFLVLLGVSVPAIRLAEEYLGRRDHPAIVVDEVLGMLIALAGLPGSWPGLAAGFVLFRLLDIWKPFPIKYMEKLPGGWGVVMDDLAAGALARGLLGMLLMFGGRG